ncbi:RxLR-like protein [Plasmopara halstedii]|uniref:RxLR-like protein n=1 Tax=Plasmopara halstedii TaxID=4781 RepID=A0A0P1AXR2_PLAHL|nr:RxLR-like protein [Plasmopara halstedii]CEG45594.1 RxLR-like protein [Plasmopara halstedii]|eukprot:XP_024581963.1 RxLR-like protein [Plasmopara halstedii]
MVIFFKILLAVIFVIELVAGDASSMTHYELYSSTATYTSTSQYAAIMLASVNSQRASRGLSALCMNVKLLAASRRHSIDMAAKNFISHLGSDGSSMAMRITEAGYRWTRAAENVAAGQVNVAAVMNSWMQSIGHRANIFGDYTMFGIAYAYSQDSTYKHYWTQNFAKGSTEACSYEDIAYVKMITSVFNSTTSPSDNSTIMLPNDSDQDGVKLDSVP